MLDLIEIGAKQHHLRDENEARLCVIRITDTLPSSLLDMVLVASHHIIPYGGKLWRGF